MYKASYDPRQMAEFFAKLEKVVGNGGPQFLSDHPNPGNRVEAVDKEIANWPPESYLASSSQFAKAKEVAKGVQAYNAQQIADGAKGGLWAQQNRKAGSIRRHGHSGHTDSVTREYECQRRHQRQRGRARRRLEDISGKRLQYFVSLELAGRSRTEFRHAGPRRRSRETTRSPMA